MLSIILEYLFRKNYDDINLIVNMMLFILIGLCIIANNEYSPH